MNKVINLWVVIMSVYIVFNPGSAYAHTEIVFGPDDAELSASIRYTVIGVYDAQFTDYRGSITFKPNTDDPESVELNIKAATIMSSCGWCDKIVRSEQLLDVERFPAIQFKSQEIYQDEDGYKVRGELSLHGITKEYTFPFVVEHNAKGENPQLSISGRWAIDRKAFGIIWNKYLDKGGVLVGNTITVAWRIST